MNGFLGLVAFAVLSIGLAGGLAGGPAGSPAEDPAGGPASGPVLAQNSSEGPDRLTENYGPWVLSCGAGRTGCYVFQALYRAKDQARLVQFTVFSPAEPDAAPVARALVPLGATISRGAVIEVDGGDPLRVPYQACWPRGCVAQLTLTPELELSLRGGETLAISVEGADTGRVIRFELALKGLAAALDRLRAL